MKWGNNITLIATLATLIPVSMCVSAQEILSDQTTPSVVAAQDIVASAPTSFTRQAPARLQASPVTAVQQVAEVDTSMQELYTLPAGVCPVITEYMQSVCQQDDPACKPLN